MNKKKPVNLDLMTIKLPFVALCSILHRLSGLLLFVLIPLSLYGLSLSLSSEKSFLAVKAFLAAPLYKSVLLLFITAFLYHLIAGIRHMVMDLGFGEHITSAKFSAMMLWVVVIVVALFVGVTLW